MKILVLGATGMLGHKVVQVLSSRFETWGTTRSGSGFVDDWDPLDESHTIHEVDSGHFSSVVRAMAEVKPDAVVNCIGIIKQLKAAHDPILSLEVNSLFPHRLASLCKASGTRLIHISTDCVFSGRKGMYREEDFSDAEDLYGRTKVLGEVTGSGCVTLRTSIIGRELGTGNGLVEWLLRNKGGRVKGFRRAIFSGFSTLALASIIATVLEEHPRLEGMFHVSSEAINKHDLLVLLNTSLGLGIEVEWDDAFVCDRSLDSTRFRQATGFQPRSWIEMVEEMAGDPTPYDAWKRQGSALDHKPARRAA